MGEKNRFDNTRDINFKIRDVNTEESHKMVSKEAKVAIPLTETRIPQYQKLCCINKKMLRFKLHFFLINGAFGIVLPFVTLLGRKQIGITDTALGSILMVQRILLIFFRIISASIADYFNILKCIVSLQMFTFALLMPMLLLIPHIIFENDTLTTCCFEELDSLKMASMDCSSSLAIKEFEKDLKAIHSKHNSDLPCIRNIGDYFHGNWSRLNQSEDHFKIFDINIPKSKHENSSTSPFQHFFCCQTGQGAYRIKCQKTVPDTSSKSIFHTYQFWLFGILYSFGAMSGSSASTLSDTACFEALRNSGGDFGKQRLFGLIGFAILSVATGLLLDKTHSYIAGFMIMVVMSLLSIWNLTSMDVVKVALTKNVFKDVGGTFKSLDFIVFEVAVFMCGLSTSVLWFFMPIFVSSIGGSHFLNGAVASVQNIICIPFMFIAEWVIKKIGHFNSMTLALFANTIRFFSFSYIHDPWLVVPIELLYGVSFGIMYVAIASYARKCSTPGSVATTQSVVFSTHEDVGVSAGSLIFGILFDNLGWHITFFYTGIAFAVATSCLVVYTMISGNCGQKPTETEDNGKTTENGQPSIDDDWD